MKEGGEEGGKETCCLSSSFHISRSLQEEGEREAGREGSVTDGGRCWEGREGGRDDTDQRERGREGQGEGGGGREGESKEGSGHVSVTP